MNLRLNQNEIETRKKVLFDFFGEVIRISL